MLGRGASILGNSDPNRWEKKPKGQEKKSTALSLGLPKVTQNIIARCVPPHGTVVELYIYVVDRHKHSSAQRSCTGFGLSRGCKDPRVTAPARD